MMYASMLVIISETVEEDQPQIIFYLYKHSDLLDIMMVQGEIDFEVLFDAGEIAVLVEDGTYVTADKTVIQPPNVFDIVHFVPFTLVEHVHLFYKQESTN